MSIFSEISKEYDRLGLVRVDCALERLSTSLGCHIFNLHNLTAKQYYYGGGLENFRLPVVFMAPSGYSKSQHLNFFLNPKTGILAKTGINTSVRGTFSPEAWMGTIQNGETTGGLLHSYRIGIVGADEFMRLGNMMNNMGVNNDEVYLMKALDGDIMTKDLSYGPIEIEDIGFTLWAGMRLCTLGLTSGMARRFSFQIFCPTIKDSINFRQASRSGLMNSRITPEAQQAVSDSITQIMERIRTIKDLDYKPINEWIDNSDYVIPHFEENLYRRIALGWAVINDTLPILEMTPGLEKLIINELWSRDVIRDSPEFEAVRMILRNSNKVKEFKLMKFLEKNYQLHKIQVEDLLNSMFRKELLARDGEWIVLPEQIENGLDY